MSPFLVTSTLWHSLAHSNSIHQPSLTSLARCFEPFLSFFFQQFQARHIDEPSISTSIDHASQIFICIFHHIFACHRLRTHHIDSQVSFHCSHYRPSFPPWTTLPIPPPLSLPSPSPPSPRSSPPSLLFNFSHPTAPQPPQRPPPPAPAPSPAQTHQQAGTAPSTPTHPTATCSLYTSHSPDPWAYNPSFRIGPA